LKPLPSDRSPPLKIKPQIGFGRVRHTRYRPALHAFDYPTFFLLLPMHSLHHEGPQTLPLARNRPGLMSFYDADHGDGRGPEQGGAWGWLQALLGAHQIEASGEIWLQCYPRILGYTFKPVSFWYCYGAEGELAAIVCEVNNTFGERHIYLLRQPRFGHDVQADKVFHVSPFCQVQGSYRFRFMQSRQRLVVRIEYADLPLFDRPLLVTSVQGQLHDLTPSTVRRALLQFPLMTFMVTVRIHLQALLLWRTRVPFFRKPRPPADFVTLSKNPAP
jgi:DUF1365 family protein